MTAHSYERRREWLLTTARADVEQLENKARFVDAVLSGELALKDMSKSELEGWLHHHEFATSSQLEATPRLFHTRSYACDEGVTVPPAIGAEGTSPTPAEHPKGNSPFGYLINTPVWQLTGESIAQAQRKQETKKERMEWLEGTSARSMWADELNEFRQAVEAFR